MKPTVEHNKYQGLTIDEINKSLKVEGFKPKFWQDEANELYDFHSHGPATLVVTQGSMTVDTGESKIELHAFDRIDIPDHFRHATTIGPKGASYFDTLEDNKS